MALPHTFDHPTFGRCAFVPDTVAIRWDHPRTRDGVLDSLQALDLSLPTHIDSPPGSPSATTSKDRDARDPRLGAVNQNALLTWAKTRSPVDEALLAKLAELPGVRWAAPTYRAQKSEQTPYAIFAVDPTTVLVRGTTGDAQAALAALNVTAQVDASRSASVKGFAVLHLPHADAIAVAAKLIGHLGADAVRMENIPFASVTTGCGCGCGGGNNGCCKDAAEVTAVACRPSLTERLPDDPFFVNQWGLQRIGAPRAWAVTEGDPSVIVAVLDEGVELAHPDLNMYPLSYSTITHTPDGSPVGNHGTACAGIIGGRIENATGVSGLAGRCRIMAIATYFSDVQVAEGLYYAADNGARVVSMSFGVYPAWGIWDFTIISAALTYAQAKGVVLVAATGNENAPVSRFPATDPTTIGVGGSNRSDVRKAVGDTSIEGFWGACYGPDVDVVAPCLEIPSSDRLGGAGYTATDYTLRFNGTSSATPHVAALAALVLSVNPALSNTEVRRILSVTTDKINQPAYVYAATAGKPHGTWNNDVGYGRINAERALQLACTTRANCEDAAEPCAPAHCAPEACCVSPCEPPWRSDDECMYWYDTRYFRAPLRGDNAAGGALNGEFIEFRIGYQHRFCLLGKQHGPLLYTQTLLPGEKVTLYHSERHRRITSETDRFAVQTTFFQYLSAVHESKFSASASSLSERLTNIKTATSVSVGGGLAGLLGLPSGGSSVQGSVTDLRQVQTAAVAETFDQSVRQSSLLVHAERSVTVSTYEEKDVADITRRTIQNDNACRAVTYFIRKVVELYAMSTRVSELGFRIVAPNVPGEWHAIDDLSWLPVVLQNRIKQLIALLPRVGAVVEQPKPVSLPTDGTVYDAELAHCSSCDPERAMEIDIKLRKLNAEALKACLETQLLELEVQRRSLLLKRGDLAAFDGLNATVGDAAG